MKANRYVKVALRNTEWLDLVDNTVATTQDGVQTTLAKCLGFQSTNHTELKVLQNMVDRRRAATDSIQIDPRVLHLLNQELGVCFGKACLLHL